MLPRLDDDSKCVVSAQSESVRGPTESLPRSGEQRTSFSDQHIGEADRRIWIPDRVREACSRPVVDETGRKRDTVASVPRKRLKGRDQPRRVEEINGLVERGEVDADVGRAACSKSRGLSGDRSGDLSEVRRGCRIGNALGDVPTGCSELASDGTFKARIARILPPHRDERIDPVAT